MLSIEEIRDQARSFPGLTPPGTLVAVERYGKETWYYYQGQDEEGEEAFYYETARGYAFKKYMAELQAKRNKEKWH